MAVSAIWTFLVSAARGRDDSALVDMVCVEVCGEGGRGEWEQERGCASEGELLVILYKGPPETNVGGGKGLIANGCMGKLGARRIKGLFAVNESQDSEVCQGVNGKGKKELRQADQFLFFYGVDLLPFSLFLSGHPLLVRTKLDVGSAPTLCGLRRKAAEISSGERPHWLRSGKNGAVRLR